MRMKDNIWVKRIMALDLQRENPHCQTREMQAREFPVRRKLPWS